MISVQGPFKTGYGHINLSDTSVVTELVLALLT